MNKSITPGKARDADVPDLQRPSYCEPHEFLLLASYCGDDNDDCTEQRPCADCLAMCNIFDESGKYLRMLGDTRALTKVEAPSDKERE